MKSTQFVKNNFERVFVFGKSSSGCACAFIDKCVTATCARCYS